MNISSTNLDFQDIVSLTRSPLSIREGDKPGCDRLARALRLVLVYNEHLRLPNKQAWRLRILTGQAWVSYNGQDFYPGKGCTLDIPQSKNGAIISAMGEGPLFFELT